MTVKQYEIWLADLSPKLGTEPGKTRPVLIIQTDLLNQLPHPSTLICPLTTHIITESHILRVSLSKGEANLINASDILIDQIRAIDNKRILKKIGVLPSNLISKVQESIKIVLDLKSYQSNL